jgi:diamine N-acetyltransferase
VWLGVWERNARAIRFYEQWDFHPAGKQPFLLGADLQTDLVMVRRIARES